MSKIEEFLKKNPDAIATNYGWVNKKTGELLVSIKGLPGAVEWDIKSKSLLTELADKIIEKIEPTVEKVMDEIDAVQAKVEEVEAKVVEKIDVIEADITKVEDGLAKMEDAIDAAQDKVEEVIKNSRAKKEAPAAPTAE
jgi:SMC interacting uncharacterized protein involved in chromosome segregation